MTTVTIVLENGDVPEPEIVARVSGVSVRTFYAVSDRLADMAGLSAFRQLAEMFAPFVEAWTYPEALGVDGLLDRDINDLLAYVRAWLRGVASAPLPLARRSSDGGQSEDSAAPSP